ncbi:MAG: ribosome maturation factor RimP [Candidatus Nanopelagicaceae bacterium]|nr:ribosome maturation factor RimP [Candidatus Nanopelagicaceae bacterium]
MSLVNNLTELLSPAIKSAGFVLEEVKVTPAGKRRIVAVIIDGEERNPSLDEVTVVSRKVSDILENYSQLGDLPFTLEVTTPGVDRPLTLPRHWRKNVGRLVKITPIDGETFTSRITSANDDSVALEAREIRFSDVKRAVIEIEFNRKEPR